MSHVIAIRPAAPRPPTRLHDCIQELPHRQRAALAGWLDAHSEPLIDDIVRVLTPLAVEMRRRLETMGHADTLCGRCAEVAPDWALDLDEGEAVFAHARLRSEFFDVVAAFTLHEREVPRPRLDPESIEQMASRLADAVLKEVLP